MTRCKPMLGTLVEISISTKKSSIDLVSLSDKAFAAIKQVERTMSFHNSASELSYINRHAYLKPCDLSPHMEEILLNAIEISEQSQGIFDVTVAPHLIKQKLLPDIGVPFDTSACWKDIIITNGCVHFQKPLIIDLGGIAKGYAVDQAIASCEGHCLDITVNAGGDLRTKLWQEKIVSIRRNNSSSDFIDVEMRDTALATSASYYLNGKNAIICPRTEHVAEQNKVASIFAPTCMMADALTKILYLGSRNHTVFNFFNVKPMVFNSN